MNGQTRRIWPIGSGDIAAKPPRETFLRTYTGIDRSVYLEPRAGGNVLVPATERGFTAAAIAIGEGRVVKSIVDQPI
jgi:hypothetical protein